MALTQDEYQKLKQGLFSAFGRANTIAEDTYSKNDARALATQGVAETARAIIQLEEFMSLQKPQPPVQ